MSDHNLVTLPVVDPEGRMIGLITVDDVLETTIPIDWRRREPPPAPPEPSDHPLSENPANDR
jgi:CBS-domain-containing membrane protein